MLMRAEIRHSMERALPLYGFIDKDGRLAQLTSEENLKTSVFNPTLGITYSMLVFSSFSIGNFYVQWQI